MSNRNTAIMSRVEQRGIEPVPEDQRTGDPRQLFWVWFAANISILGIPLGASLVAFQLLNIWQALIVAFVGSVGGFALVGVVSIAGRRGGAPSMTLSRAVFGTRGNAGPTLVSLLSRLGWETVNTTTAAFVLLSVFAVVFGTSAVAAEVPMLVILAVLIFEVCTLLVSGLGHAAILVIQKWATWIFGALTIFVGTFLIATVDWAVVVSTEPAPVGSMLIGIGVIAAGTGIGWANAAADMARYQPHGSRSGALITASSLGAGIPLVTLIGLGALVTAGNPELASASDPVAAIRALLPPWMVVPYLITAFGGLLLSNHLSVYSAGLTTLTLGLRVKRVYAVTVDVVITFLGAIYFMLITGSFYGPFITLISLLAIPITAWLAVFLVDMAKRRYYDPEGLLDLRPGSRYWYRGGFEWRAVGAWAAATVVGVLFTRAGSGDEIWFAGPLASTVIGENGLAWVATFVVAGGLYLALGGARGIDLDGPVVPGNGMTSPAQPAILGSNNDA